MKNNFAILNFYDKGIIWSIYLLVFLTPLTIFPFINDIWNLPKITIVKFFTLTACCFYFLKIIKQGRFTLHKNILLIPICFFIIVILFSTLFSQDFNISFYGSFANGKNFISLIFYILLWFVVSQNFQEEQKIKNLLLLMFISSFFVSAIGLFQYFTANSHLSIVEAKNFRVFSTIGDPNVLANFLAGTIPLILIISFFNGISVKTIINFAILSIVLCLLLTNSRGGLITLFIASSITYIFLAKVSVRKFIFLACIIFLTLISVLWIGKYKNNFIKKIMRKETAISRLIMWKDTLYIIKKYPFLGDGLNNFEKTYRYFRSKQFINIEGNYRVPDTPHNEVLEVTANSGFLGLFSYLFVICSFIFCGFNKLKNTLKPFEKKLLVITFTCVFIYLISLQFSFSAPANQFQFWLFLSLGTVSIKNKKNSKNKKNDKINKLPFKNVLYLFIISFFLICNVIIFKPVVADYYFLNGKYLMYLQKKEEALLNFKKAVKINPRGDDYYITLAKVYLDMAMFSSKNKDEQIALFDKSIKSVKISLKIFSEQSPYYFFLANVYNYYSNITNNSMLLKKSLIYYKKALKGDPNNLDIKNKIKLMGG